MTYHNLPENLWGKMDSCVEKVIAQDMPKSNAIAICYSSLTGKKAIVDGDKAYQPIVELQDKQPQGTSVCVINVDGSNKELGGAEPIIVKVRCIAPECAGDATKQVSVEGNTLNYCDECVVGAMELLAKYHIDVDSVLDIGANLPVTIAGAPVIIVSSAAKQYEDSVILALRPPADVAEEISIEDGLSQDDLHMTLIYLGNTSDIDKDLLLSAISGFAANSPPIHAKLNGVIRFADANDAKQHALAVNVDAVELPLFRQTLLSTLANLGFAIEDAHGFTPHMTLAYIDQDAEAQDVVLPDTGKVLFDALWVFWGDEHSRFEFGGEVGTKGHDLDKIAAAIASHKDVKVSAESIKKHILEPWLISTAATPEALHLQALAYRTFGLSDGGRLGLAEVEIKDWKLLQSIGAIYNAAQEELGKRGLHEKDTLEVYHPFLPQEGTPKQWSKGQEVRIYTNPLSSWTTDLKEAMMFASFLSSAGSPAFVLRTFIPVSSVVSTPNVGFGTPYTSEIVLAGGEYEAIVEMRSE